MAEKPKEQIETAPDPDEDDLDDLDDVLDEFQITKTTKPSASSEKSTATQTTSGPSKPLATASKDGAALNEEELAEQLQAGMSNLMAELDSNPDMQKQFEAMMQELIAAGAAPTVKDAGNHLKEAAQAVPRAPVLETGSSSNKKAAGGDDFSETIRRTMERMQQSGDAATAASTTGAEQSEDDLLAQMMKELSQGGEGGDEDFNKMLMSMMSQLTNKEILYEPMKELHDKFPAWLAANSEKTIKEDLDRYKEQKTLVGEIVARFESKSYSDNNEDDREYIVERMQKMQAAGSPPPDLVGDMSAAQEALGDLDSGCPTQ
ncbi:peroxisomal biogenesis factor 19-like protein [Acrodontium crateriforme]|uniref:Peroxisomal biogenesis factor 19-like protein n=1 Tax=Acrodontium crateriforme TaxID=150365 RepID=A0AAQ3R9Q5_9PEZI|nr:peroxisomal biogenesis factor 19-like protein [Acrodontium crateriforme]